MPFSSFQLFSPILRERVVEILERFGDPWNGTIAEFKEAFAAPEAPYRAVPKLVIRCMPWLRFLQFLRHHGCNNSQISELAQKGATLRERGSESATLPAVKSFQKDLAAVLQKLDNPQW